MSTITAEMVSSRWQTNSLLPMQKISNGFISPQMSNFHTTCNWTCWTTWRKPWRRWTEKKFFGVSVCLGWFVFLLFLSCTVTADGLCTILSVLFCMHFVVMTDVAIALIWWIWKMQLSFQLDKRPGEMFVVVFVDLPRSLFALFLCWMAKRISGWGSAFRPLRFGFVVSLCFD